MMGQLGVCTWPNCACHDMPETCSRPQVSPKGMLAPSSGDSGAVEAKARRWNDDRGPDRSVCRLDPPSFGDCVIGWDWTEPTHVLYDSRTVKRGSAIAATASEYGLDFKDARCAVAYARWLSPQEIWDNGAGERWWDDQGHFEGGKWVPHDDEYADGPPESPVEGWKPDPERDAVFELCDKNAPGAVKVWKVETGL